jgi:nuclear pore complex protein Nup205
LITSESKQRSKQFAAALKDGAFDFILSLSADVKSSDWHDPARHGLRQWLQRKAPPLLSDSIPFADFFQGVLMEQLESFIEGFITNLPDILRKLRLDEDEQRQLSNTHDHELDLERFIVTISYAFEGRPKAALEAFWDVPDGALMGFIQWASRRASTPLVSAFCEMLQAISEDDECGTSAHQFLLDEGSQSSGKMRRTHSLTWDQIFKELNFFSSKLRDRPAAPQTYGPGKPNSDHAEMEPESFLMLECYLRLITRLCTASTEARLFLTQHQSFHLTELLFQLASSSIQPRLKACAFTTLQALLTHKSKEAGDYMWTALDVWISGGNAPGSSMPKTSTTVPISAVSAERILRGLGTGFEEPNAFVQLLHALVAPYDGESGLHDGLPFPENLGASNRMPGIDPYVDFAVGQVFGAQTSELNDVVQMRLLQLTCLDFIATCLDTFNEDLLIFANRSSVMVDSAINASNLQTYVLLHPFSRVMEWMFNEKIMNALFATIHQDVEDVASAAPDSPLILCLLRGIHVLTSILDLQPTYLDIVRPVVKSHSTHRRIAVANAAFASFEDGILNHLSIIPDLGLYCGSGHADLVITSLTLLEKLSASPKLASAPGVGLGRRSDRNKAIAALEANGDTEAISRILLQEIAADIDINQGPASATYITKLKILDFLTSCLKASPGQPTIAHLLLGFECNNNVLDVDINGPFNNGISLFHAILWMVLDIPLIEETGLVSSWLVTLKYKGLQVLQQLWQTPLSSTLTMVELRASQALFVMFSKPDLIQPELVWEDRYLADPDFLLSPAASCLSDFLSQRALTLQYVSAELRQISNLHSPSLKKRVFATLLGSTATETGEQIENPSVFDLFEFVELEFSQPGTLSAPKWFQDMDLEVCLATENESLRIYNISKVRELLLLRRAELEKGKKLENPQDAALVDVQSQELISFCVVDNQVKYFWASRLRLLRAWVQLVQLMIETGDFEGQDKTSLILRTLRTILASLENKLENIDESMELARLAKSLIFNLEFDSESFKQGDMGDLVSDRLFHLFQVSLRAINSLGANPPLKEVFYTISYRYLTGMSDVSGISGIYRRHSTQTIKAAGERFIDIVCDDAYAGEPMCRISALLFLGALVKIAEKDNSRYIIESLGRLNYIGILVDSIRSIPNDLRETSREGRDFLQTYR